MDHLNPLNVLEHNHLQDYITRTIVYRCAHGVPSYRLRGNSHAKEGKLCLR